MQSLPLSNLLAFSLPGFSLAASDPYAGLLSRVQSGEQLLLTGYAAPPGTAAVELTPAAATPRLVVRVAEDGSVSADAVAAFGGDGQAAAGYIRAAASDDTGDVWVAGTDAVAGGTM